jgi:CheY-like chemotaxis protein
MTATTHILLVDESTFFLAIERQFLKNTPAALLEARDAEEALALSRRQRPSLVYMAYDLAGTDGAECCRRLKADPGLRSVPVILICDEQRHDHLELCRQAGCDGVLTKPLDRRRFLDLGRSFLCGIREPRRPCLIRVRLRWRNERLSVSGLDISTGGVFLESGEPASVGERVELELLLTQGGQARFVQAVGEIAWLNLREKPLKPTHPVGFGVKFTELAAETKLHLAEFLEKMRDPLSR